MTCKQARGAVRCAPPCCTNKPNTVSLTPRWFLLRGGVGYPQRGAYIDQLRVLFQRLPERPGPLPERVAVLPVTMDTENPEQAWGGGHRDR